MKTLKTLLATVVVAATLSATPVMAQQSDPYWVVETNAKTKDYTIVRFYNGYGSSEPFYEERLAGVHLNFRRKKVQQQLNQAMQKALQNQAVTQQAMKNQNLVAGILKR